MTTFHDRIAAELADIDAQGLTKPERIIASRQGPVIEVAGPLYRAVRVTVWLPGRRRKIRLLSLSRRAGIAAFSSMGSVLCTST